MAEDYEYDLKWCGREDSPKLRGAFERCKVVSFFECVKPRLVTHREFMQMVADGKVADNRSWWGVEPGQVGMVALSGKGSSTQWNMISNCKADFESGWEHAVQFMKEGGI